MSTKKKDYQIPLSEAELWTTIWRRACKDNCKAFLIHVEDLMGVMTEMGVLQKTQQGLYKYDEGSNRDVRAYMAIDPAHGMPGGGEKILLVGTEKVPDPSGKPGQYQYKDIIDGHVLLGDGDDSGIYDFSRPCPSACDDDSPLNGGGD
mgnify:CR=1 FL=1|tara:strand:+ start:68166 stop:68609 length:444 start_codon:yes stop_codon:yes gene_type:complete